MKKTFFPADILIPKTDHTKWSVIACDQYTSEPEYWEKVKKNVGDGPTSLNIIFPEVYLSCDNCKGIESINTYMNKYLNDDTFTEYKNSMILTKRTLSTGEVREGIVGVVDLEDYSYETKSNALIRATEKTVTERIPPRVEIRKDACIEIPHVMLLIDDPDKTVIEPLAENSKKYQTVYDFDLMLGAGKINGCLLDEESISQVQMALSKLEEKGKGFLFAVGDGNHSLACAKECYKLNKTQKSRYALVEVVNLHSPSLNFEPIYRVVFGVNPIELINDFVKSLGGEYHGADAQKFICVFAEKELEVSVKPTAKLSVGTLQTYLDEYITNNPQVTIDYIHGENSVRAITRAENTVGFIFDGMRKDELFSAVRQDGSLPRKTFSMGHADDKRFYLEARKI